ncbi:MAG: histidinol dehydrogenase [Desulfohalobiaceae bacterium]
MVCPRVQVRNYTDLQKIQNRLLQRTSPDPDLQQQVQDILEQVRSRGDQALVEYSRRFDCQDYQPEHIKLGGQKLRAALDAIPNHDLELIQECIDNIRSFHSKQNENSWISLEDKGLVLGQLVRPVQRAGLYVPGGKSGETPLISSLIMGAVPAQVAGVQEIVACSPPGRDGNLNPYTLATAHLLGLSAMYALGSAWAVAAMAYGTKSVPKVDVLAGPGNTYVTLAKKLLMGQVGLDMLAGPSEILILADSQAHPEWLAADMLSQAEHDPWAAAIVVSDDQNLLDRTEKALQLQLQKLPRKEAASKALADWGGLIQVHDLNQGLELVNLLAPEHLELCLQDPWSWLGKVQNAGAIFLGQMTPEPIGDYFAGPNHTLPTMGNARFASALSVQTFYKKSSILSGSKEYLEQNAEKISRLARLEGLEGHARSVDIRFNNN